MVNQKACLQYDKQSVCVSDCDIFLDQSWVLQDLLPSLLAAAASSALASASVRSGTRLGSPPRTHIFSSRTPLQQTKVPCLWSPLKRQSAAFQASIPCEGPGPLRSPNSRQENIWIPMRRRGCAPGRKQEELMRWRPAVGPLHAKYRHGFI